MCVVTGSPYGVNDKSREIGAARKMLTMTRVLSQQAAYRFLPRVSTKKKERGNIRSPHRELFMTQYIISSIIAICRISGRFGKVSCLVHVFGKKRWPSLIATMERHGERETSMKGETREKSIRKESVTAIERPGYTLFHRRDDRRRRIRQMNDLPRVRSLIHAAAHK